MHRRDRPGLQRANASTSPPHEDGVPSSMVVVAPSAEGIRNHRIQYQLPDVVSDHRQNGQSSVERSATYNPTINVFWLPEKPTAMQFSRVIPSRRAKL